MKFEYLIDRGNPLPLYAQLKEAMQQDIRNGKIGYGEKIPSENELAESLGLSRMTVRAALSQLVNENYVQKQHGKGTFVCFRAGTAVTGKVHVLLDVTYAYFSSYYIKSIADVLTQKNYQFVIHDTQDSQSTICDILEQILQGNCSGIILQPSHYVEPITERFKNIMLSVQQRSIPCIAIDCMPDEIPCYSVMFDDYGAGRLAAEHLISLGHEKFAMVCCSKFTENKPRFEGFNSVLKEQGLTPLFAVEKDITLPEKLISVINDEKVTAVFNYNDEVALKTFRILSGAGIKIPQDVSVIGFDDTILAKATYPQMTTVIHPKEQIGRTAAQNLIELIEHRSGIEMRTVLSPNLRVRESCAIAKTENF